MQEGEKSVYDHEQRGTRVFTSSVPKPKNAFQLFNAKERQKIKAAEPSCVFLYILIVILAQFSHTASNAKISCGTSPWQFCKIQNSTGGGIG